MVKILRSHKRLLSIAMLLAGIVLLTHAWLGTPHGHSYKHNLPWIDAFRTAFWAGDLYPRFLPDLWFGFGGADFYFYGPMPFWFSSVVGAVSCPGCEAGQALSISGAWMLILSGLSFFVFARRFFTTLWAGIGGVIYVFLPYHYLVDWFARQSIGEVAVYIFLPLIALATIRLLTEKRGGGLLAVSIAATALSHLPSALIVAHFLPLIVIWHAHRTKLERLAFATCLLRFGAWGGLGVLLAAIYWLPAFSLLSSVSPSVLYSDYFEAKNWLLLDGRPEPNPSVSILAKWCLAFTVTTCLSAWYVIRRNSDAAVLRDWILIPCLLTAFLTTVFSALIWDVWILNKIQFPWRFLVITDLSTALAGVVILKQLWSGFRTSRQIEAIAAASLSGLVFCATVFNIAPQVVDAAIEGHTLDGAYRVTGAPEYVPAGVLKPAFDDLNATAPENGSDAERYVVFFDVMEARYQRAQAAMQSDTALATLHARTQGRYLLNVELESAGSVRVPIAYWSFWRARLANGAPVPLEQDLEQGLITLSLPAGRSEVELYLVQTRPEKIGAALSCLAILVLLISVMSPAIARWRGIVSSKKAFATSVM